MAALPDSCLAQVVRLEELRPIPDVDRIELGRVMGWWVVIRKDEFKVGDLAVYVKIGSVLDPSVADFSFLEGKPIKTKKIRGAVSQGLIGPLSWLPTGASKEEGVDVTAELRVRKYIEPEESSLYGGSGSSRKMPEAIPKTDERRVQDFGRASWEQLKGRRVVVTRKEDGCSGTYFLMKNAEGAVEFGICSRNYRVDGTSEATEHFLRIGQGMEDKMKKADCFTEFALQGEVVGPKINGNRLKLPKLDYRVFNVWDIETQRYLPHAEVMKLCEGIGVATVPVIAEMDITENMLCASYWLAMAETVSYGPGIPAEGIVIKTCDSGPRISFKAISNAFLLKHGK
jgi:RNA ligase (TIGR02306 family)